MAKTQKIDLQLKGLQTNLGDLSKPPGSMTIAENFDLPTLGFMPSRRGITPTNVGTGIRNYQFEDYSVHQMFSSLALGKSIIAHVGQNLNPNAAQRLYQVTDGTIGAGATWLEMPDGGNVGATSAIRSRMIQDTKNHFIAAVTPAPVRLESDIPTLSGVTYAGMPRPPGIDWNQQLNPELTAGSGEPQYWLQENYSVAYRCTFVATDNDGKERESAPSGRYVVANMNQYSGWVAGRAAAPITRWQIPFKTNTLNIPWAAEELKIRVYRSISVILSTSLPNDEMQLAYEAKVTANDIANGYVTVTDWTPDFALGAYLYTNSISGGDVGTGVVMSGAVGIGIAAENDRPPYCTDAATFANCAFYANTTSLCRLTFSLIAVGVGSQVFEDGDLIAIDSDAGSITLKGVTTLPADPSQFRLYTSSSPSIAWSIRRSVENMVAAMNKNAQTGKFGGVGTYIGNDSSPGTVGQVMVESIRQQDGYLRFVNTGAPSTAFQPYLGVETGQIDGKRDVFPNGLAISKPLLLDSVPPINMLSIAGPDNQIQRVISVSDALFIFMQRGIWIIRGDGPSNFVLQQYDTEFRLWNRESVVAYKDYVYAWGYEGIIRLSVGGGIERIDMPIRNMVEGIWQYINPFNETLPQRGWALVQPHWNRVMFFYPFFDEDQINCTRALVYHIDTGAWTTYKFWYLTGSQNNGWNCGVVRPFDSFTWFGYKTQTFNEVVLGLMQNSTNDLYPSYDMGQSPGSTFSIQNTIRWATSVPNPHGLTAWSDFEFFVQPYLYTDPVYNGNPSGAAVPDSTGGPYNVEILSDMNQLSTNVVGLLTGDKGRLMLSRTNGLATKQTVTIKTAGFTAFTGMSFLIRPLSGWNAR